MVERSVFESELKLIKDLIIRTFVEKVLCLIPEYNIYLPSSSTGKYHPLEDRGDYGNLFHTKKVVQWSLIFARVFNISGLDLDILIASAILHDMAKRGLDESPSSHTIPNHASLMLDPMGKVYMDMKPELDQTVFKKIAGAVVYHNGRWTESGYKKPITDFSTLELCLHLADMAAANMHKVFVKKNKGYIDKLNFMFGRERNGDRGRIYSSS